MASVPPLTARTLQWKFSIGGFEFSKFEVPESIKLGVDVETKTHKYISESGKATVRTHTQGAFLVETTWKAVFTGTNALTRARQLYNLANLGLPTLLIYGPNSWHVIIKKFHYTPRWQYEVDYEIDVQLVDDQNGLDATELPTSLDAQTDIYLARAHSGFADLSAVNGAQIPPTLVSAVGSADTTLGNAYPLRAQNFSTIGLVTTALGTVNTELSKYIGTLTASTGTSALASLALAQVTQAAYGLLTKSVASITSANRTKTITNATSLIAVAAQFYPKADPVTSAQYLAQVNGLTSLFIAPQTPLIIPPLLATNAH